MLNHAPEATKISYHDGDFVWRKSEMKVFCEGYRRNEMRRAGASNVASALKFPARRQPNPYQRGIQMGIM